MKQLQNRAGFGLIILALTASGSLCGCKEESKSPPGQEVKKHPPASYTVSIQNMQFVPDSISMQPGDTLLFINKDLVPHDVTQFPQKGWTSSLLQPGDSWQFVPEHSDDYFCSIHVVMKGKIRLK